MGRRALALALVLSSVGLAVCGHARAAERKPVGLNWVRLEGAESCISAPQLADRVERIGGSPRFSSTLEAERFIDGSVRPADGNAWLVVIEISDPQGRVLGHRELLARGADCGVIDQAIAFLLAVYLYQRPERLDPQQPLAPALIDFVDPLIEDEPSDGSDLLSDSPPQPAATPATPAAPVREPTQRSSPPDVPSWRMGAPVMTASVVGTVGQLPSPSMGLAVHELLMTGLGWPLELGFTYFFDQQEHVHATNGQINASLMLGSLAACPLQPFAGVALCGGTEVGRLGLATERFVHDGSTSQVVVDVFGSGLINLRVAGPLHLRAELSLAAPLTRRPYVLETRNGSKQLFRMSIVSGCAQFGLGAQF